MNNSERQQLLDVISAMSHRYPEWRLGQLVSNLASLADADVWDAEDRQLLDAASRHWQQTVADSNTHEPQESAA